MKRFKLVITTLLLFISSTLFSQSTMYVHVINVGQGSATLIEFPCGVILVDTGGESNELFQSTDALMNYLDEFFSTHPQFNNTIDLLMLSHPHIDHTRGAKEVAAKYKVKNLVTNSETLKGSGIAGQKYLQQLAAQSEGTSSIADDINYFASSTRKIPAGGLTNAVIDPINCVGADPIIKLLWGTPSTKPAGWSNEAFGNQNNHSVVCRIDFGQSSILLTGDLEDVAMTSLLSKHSQQGTFDSDVYLVGHHGSKNGTTLPFLQAVTPEIAILSFGDKDRELSWTAWAYGHPNKDIVQMLSNNVSGTRPPKTVFIGNGAKTFTTRPMSKAVYGVGWDDSFVLSANLAGTWTFGATPSLTDSRININSASEEELQTLPTIGPARARAIVAYRAGHPFTDAEELDNVEGIGPATVQLLLPLVKV